MISHEARKQAKGQEMCESRGAEVKTNAFGTRKNIKGGIGGSTGKEVSRCQVVNGVGGPNL